MFSNMDHTFFPLNQDLWLLWTTSNIFHVIFFLYLLLFPPTSTAGVSHLTVPSPLFRWEPLRLTPNTDLYMTLTSAENFFFSTSAGHSRGSIYPLWYVCKHFYSNFWFLSFTVFITVNRFTFAGLFHLFSRGFLILKNLTLAILCLDSALMINANLLNCWQFNWEEIHFWLRRK